jgi:hypothetical protein
MPQNYFYSYAEASRAEEMIPSMTYAALLQNLGRLTDLGVLAHGNPVSMLVAARLVDRQRIERSGLSPAALKRALGEYRSHPNAVYGIVKALEQAVETSLRGV